MTELEQAAVDLAKAYWRLDKGGFINAYDPQDQGECDHLQGIANTAMKTIARLSVLNGDAP